MVERYDKKAGTQNEIKKEKELGMIVLRQRKKRRKTGKE